MIKLAPLVLPVWFQFWRSGPFWSGFSYQAYTVGRVVKGAILVLGAVPQLRHFHLDRVFEVLEADFSFFRVIRVEAQVESLFDVEDIFGLLVALGRDSPHRLEHEDVEVVHDEYQEHLDAVGVVGLVEAWSVHLKWPAGRAPE